ncbi:hypothetical protein Pint_31419 [Pistacia integerrima]|uniref:Uncharacterized protein n=1 Tax=Pistacia integerrima TaxID=434235 RepID=A0ACC0XQE5_9ROSI|nr:hypothetical protein Pint_31419 [Pistacia integerrima]
MAPPQPPDQQQPAGSYVQGLVQQPPSYFHDQSLPLPQMVPPPPQPPLSLFVQAPPMAAGPPAPPPPSGCDKWLKLKIEGDCEWRRIGLEPKEVIEEEEIVMIEEVEDLKSEDLKAEAEA